MFKVGFSIPISSILFPAILGRGVFHGQRYENRHVPLWYARSFTALAVPTSLAEAYPSIITCTSALGVLGDVCSACQGICVVIGLSTEGTDEYKQYKLIHFGYHSWFDSPNGTKSIFRHLLSFSVLICVLFPIACCIHHLPPSCHHTLPLFFLSLTPFVLFCFAWCFTLLGVSFLLVVFVCCPSHSVPLFPLPFPF